MTWKTELANRIETIDDLKGALHIEDGSEPGLADVLEQSPMAIPRPYLSLIDPSDEDDPIRKMSVPSPSEADPSGSLDTSGEASNTVMRGLQHKYRETALLLSTGECAMYCRHCFRKRLVGRPDEEILHDLEGARAYLQAHPEINNVLVSGGDALLNSNERIDRILGMLACVPSLDFIRIATRAPATLPTRIVGDDELLAILAKHRESKQLYLVTQFNHPREITRDAAAAVEAVLKLGIPVRNQAVLLRGVNDGPDVLAPLLSGLTAIGAEPYYVFQCRPVAGVKNRFQVPLIRGAALVEEARARQNGIGKALRYCMSHTTGKIEIVGQTPGGLMAFKYHEAKDRRNLGRVFFKELGPDQAWLPEREPATA